MPGRTVVGGPLQTTKPDDKKFEVVPNATVAMNLALRLERMRLREDDWVSRDGPDAL